MDFHIPVMCSQVISNLVTRGEGTYVDCTLGGGGHAKEIMKKIYPDGLLLGIDQDIEALESARENLQAYLDRVILLKSNFMDLDRALSDLGIGCVSGILFDLGLSSYQVDSRSRGFSFLEDDLLDMRMDLSQSLNARYIVNHYSEKELWELFSNYGEEHFSRTVARMIVQERKKVPLDTTKQLSDLITRIYARYQKKRWRIHPATRVFQALRIEVNRELEVLEAVLDKAVRCLEQEGRICVISYHSLEDRIVKQHFRKWADKETVFMHGFGLKLRSKKPLYPSTDEIKENPRARSARIRIAEKILSEEVFRK